MKRLIAGLVAVLMLTPSLCYASSMDKALHISASAVTEIALAHNKPLESVATVTIQRRNYWRW